MCICGFLRCSDPHPEKAIFTSGSSASQGEGCDDFLYLVLQGLSGDGFFFHVGGKMRGKVLRKKPPKTEMP